MNTRRYTQAGNRKRYERIRKQESGTNKRTMAANAQMARNRPDAEKQAIWASIKREAPDLIEIFKVFPGTTVLSWEENGQPIGEDYST